MRCAIIDTETRKVVNMVEADPATDRAPAGHELVEIPADKSVDTDWQYSTARGFMVSPEAASRIEAAKTAQRETQHGKLILMAREKPALLLNMIGGGNG